METIGTHSTSCRPVTGLGMVYTTMGFSKGILLAVRPDGEGHVTESHVAWRYTKAAPKKPSILIRGDLLFMIDDGGVAACLDARTGTEIWKKRIGGNFSASPIMADQISNAIENSGISISMTWHPRRFIKSTINCWRYFKDG